MTFKNFNIQLGYLKLYNKKWANFCLQSGPYLGIFLKGGGGAEFKKGTKSIPSFRPYSEIQSSYFVQRIKQEIPFFFSGL